MVGGGGKGSCGGWGEEASCGGVQPLGGFGYKGTDHLWPLCAAGGSMGAGPHLNLRLNVTGTVVLGPLVSTRPRGIQLQNPWGISQ